MSTVKFAAPRKRKRRWIMVVVLALVATMASWLAVSATGNKRVTAYFTSVVGLYPQSDVRVLGVPVGTVTSVQPKGKSVKVEMNVQSDVDIPAKAQALIVTPSVVSDRYLQLAPVYTGGKRIEDGAEIPVERTAAPVELDELFQSLNELTVALGPEGANANGAVDQLLQQSAKTLQGNGKPLGKTIRRLGDLARTLDGSKEDLFKTVDELSKFTGMLKSNDQQVKQVINQLSSITGVLAEDRDDLAAALAELNDAVVVVQDFVRDNRGKIKSNVDKLAEITQVLADQEASLAEAIDTVPNAMTNLIEAYNPETATIDARTNLNEYRAASPTLPFPSAGGAR